ncbi:AraC family transcriptional regulator [Nodosilinea sp. LEGE 07088]|uniref:AraC family transcriptional regulator n=1 Tax=Nodosilinea sp. LEGE 07088 TaxID=2777968 RepID=UPI0019DA0983|nr:AraC family transcriptional regulator [Nodosilinea sp. LEGE 07088]MBE9138227.1 AraC family transcriptional regulator [Nodosilinea sp. LEGE 07088]
MRLSLAKPNIEPNVKIWRPDGSAYELLSASGITTSMPRQIFQEYLIGVIEQGQANFTYRGEKFYIGGGSLLLIQPGEPFAGQGSPEHPRTFRMLHTSPQFLQRLISDLTEREAQLPHFNQPIELNPSIIQAFSRIHRALEMPHSRLERDSWLLKITALLLQHCIVEPPQLPPSRRESDRVKQVRSFLMERFTENVSLEELSALVNLSPFRLNRVFSQEVGVPPHAFLNQVRVWQAKAQLARGIPIAQVAVETGFYDQAHLTRHFKRLLGYTPGIIQGGKNVQSPPLT